MRRRWLDEDSGQLADAGKRKEGRQARGDTESASCPLASASRRSGQVRSEP